MIDIFKNVYLSFCFEVAFLSKQKTLKTSNKTITVDKLFQSEGPTEPKFVRNESFLQPFVIQALIFYL